MICGLCQTTSLHDFLQYIHVPPAGTPPGQYVRPQIRQSEESQRDSTNFARIVALAYRDLVVTIVITYPPGAGARIVVLIGVMLVRSYTSRVLRRDDAATTAAYSAQSSAIVQIVRIAAQVTHAMTVLVMLTEVVGCVGQNDALLTDNLQYLRLLPASEPGSNGF